MTVRLRQFQSVLERDIYQAWASGARNVLAVSATGSGKTVLFSKIIADNVGASIAIAHRQELVSQISLALARNGVRHRIIGSDTLRRACTRLHIDELNRSYVDPNAMCAVAGVDTLVNMDPKTPWFQQVTLVVQDEGHHALVENKWGRAAALFPNARGLFVTATPERADGKGLGRHADGLIDAMVLAPSMRDLINMGYLTDYRIIAPPVQDLNLSKVEVSATTGDFNATQLRAAVHQSSRIVGDVVQHYLKWAAGKLGVTFAVDVAAASEIAVAFRAAGVPAEVISAKTPDALRAAILRRFKNREILQLVNVDLFGEGFDLPAIEVVSFARPTASFTTFCQQFGRALRLMIDPTTLSNWDSYSDDERRYFISICSKPVALIIDHVSNVVRHGLPDKRKTWSLDRREKRSRGFSQGAIPLRNCLNPQCAAVYERVYVCCPECGFYPEPAGRGSPAMVDGDLVELDPTVLAVLRGEIARVDNSWVPIPHGATDIIRKGIQNRHYAAQQAQIGLRLALKWYGGLYMAYGWSLNEAWRRFYHTFGTDVATAQTLGAREADELKLRVSSHLAKYGIDATVNDALAYSNAQRIEENQ